MLRHFTDSQWVGPAVLAVSIGAGAGVAAVGFRSLIELMRTIFFDGLGVFSESWLGPFFPILVLATGGAIVGLITKYFAPETKGHGVPEVMLATAMYGGRIRPRVAIFKALAAAVCIGSGGSAGREGPIVQIGSALGSAVGQWLKLPDRRVILCLACGAAGGVAATFNAPIAGVMFALEVILARFSSTNFGLVVLSSATATVVHQSMTGENHAAFEVSQSFALASGWELILFAIMGVLAALVAQVYMRSLYFVEDGADRLPIPEWVKPAIGGAIVGAIGMYDNRIFATGYESINTALEGNMIFSTMAILCILKIVSTSFTIGSGGSGGVFAPALFIGAMFGGAFGSGASTLFPGMTAQPGAYALVGMAAVFAGAARAPITSILILFEMTDDYQIILPLMTATVIATFMSQRISPESIYTVKLRRRGIDLGAVPEVNLMDAISVGEAMETEFETVRPEMPLTALIMKFATGNTIGYPVVTHEGKLLGLVTKTDIERAKIEATLDQTTVGDICTRDLIVVRPEQSLSTALSMFGARSIKRVVVIDPLEPERVVGMLDGSCVVAAYAEAYRTAQERVRRADHMSTVSQRAETVLIEEAVTLGAPIVDTMVKDAGFPKGTTLAAIRRGDETEIPNGMTTIGAGDVLVIVCTHELAESTRKWLKAQC